MTILHINNVSFAYDDVPVLHQCTSTIPSQCVTGILGANGVGKSTLLQLCAGLLRPQAGSIVYGDQQLQTMSLAARARLLAYVPQRFSCPFTLSVHDFVMLGRYPFAQTFGRSNPQDRAIVARILHDLSLTALGDHSIHHISGGEWQRVQIARALAQTPAVLLLDEPSTHLDWQHQSRVMAMLRAWAREHALTIVCTHHDVNLAARTCDHIVLLQQGAVLIAGTPEHVLTPHHISAALQVPVRWSHALTIDDSL